MLSVKQVGIKYHFLSLWYDATWDWAQVSQVIGEHSSIIAIKVNIVVIHKGLITNQDNKSKKRKF